MSEKPNVLILFTDQQRFDTINYTGHSHMITPNLDRLACQGFSYINAHSTNPVCMPARHDLITGLPAKAHGYFTNLGSPITDYGLPTLPRIFSENGYRTAGIGKMHFCPSRMHHGFDELFIMEELPKCRQDDQYATYLQQEGLGNLQNIHGIRPLIYHVPQNSQMDEEHHGSSWVGQKTIKWLEENGDNPFFLFAGWIHPHPPWDIPENFQGIYQDKEIPEPIPVYRTFPDPKEENNWFGDTDSKEEKRRVREAYYSAITLVDKNIGKILDYLEKENKIDNTIIIFTSDHGEMLYDKGYFSKEIPYESSIRVPLIIRYPDKFTGGVIKEDFADLFDIMPTLLDLCGLKYDEQKYKLPGESLCTENSKRDRNYQISSYGTGKKRWIVNRNHKFKYIYFYNQGTEELYNIKEDPEELVNLIKNGNYPHEVYQELKRGAIEYEKQWGPKDVIKNNNFIALPGGEDHPCVRGKYHFWANSQMQYFDNRCNEKRGKEFIREFEKALKNYEHSGKNIDELFDNPEWIQDFKEKWEKFGSGNEIINKIISGDCNTGN